SQSPPLSLPDIDENSTDTDISLSHSPDVIADSPPLAYSSLGSPFFLVYLSITHAPVILEPLSFKKLFTLPSIFISRFTARYSTIASSSS
ncbi:unnamed protein product, partial [Brassica oleracea var. botrytis]